MHALFALLTASLTVAAASSDPRPVSLQTHFKLNTNRRHRHKRVKLSHAASGAGASGSGARAARTVLLDSSVFYLTVSVGAFKASSEVVLTQQRSARSLHRRAISSSTPAQPRSCSALPHIRVRPRRNRPTTPPARPVRRCCATRLTLQTAMVATASEVGRSSTTCASATLPCPAFATSSTSLPPSGATRLRATASWV